MRWVGVGLVLAGVVMGQAQVDGASNANARLDRAQEQQTAWRQEIDHLHVQREAYLRNPEGWLALVALQWLKPGETTVGSAAGNAVRLEHAPAHLLTLRQQGGRVTVVTRTQVCG